MLNKYNKTVNIVQENKEVHYFMFSQNFDIFKDQYT